VEDTGEVNWLVDDVLHMEVAIPVIALSVMQLIASRDDRRMWVLPASAARVEWVPFRNEATEHERHRCDELGHSRGLRYIPGKSTGSGPETQSHETACILNAGDRDAHIKIMVYFANRDPAGPFLFTVPARRTHHFRFNDFRDPETIPVDTEFASVIYSDVPIVVQHTRLNSRQEALALPSTIAYASN
jgi:hypothetical protein